jgi:ATP phosphoribosyltransferase
MCNKCKFGNAALAGRRAKHNKYIMLNAPNTALARISALLRGAKSPSILPLAESGWSSLHAVVADTDFWRVIGELKAADAQGILVLPIEKMID